VVLACTLAQPLALAQQPPPPVASAAPATGYRLAFNAGVAVGKTGWGTELAGISELGARVQLRPWLGVGLSYLRLSAGNNEGYDPFSFDAFEVSAAWHPVVGKWFDPFMQAGALGVVSSGGGYMHTETTSHLGLEGMAGFDFVWLPLAVGVHARSGFTNDSWTLVGLHIELRL